jgi:hypothetical protein
MTRDRLVVFACSLAFLFSVSIIGIIVRNAG